MLLSTVASLLLAYVTSAQDLPVCIIGAGIAGLKAGSDLEKAQIPYIILEGSDRIGGRVFPVAYGDGYLQYGATYINGDKNPLYSIAQANGLIDLHATNDGDDYVPIHMQNDVIDGNDLHEFTDFVNGLEDKFAEFAAEGRETETLTDAFEKEYQAFLKSNNRSSHRTNFDAMARMYLNDAENEWAAPPSGFALSNFAKYDDGSEESTEYTLTKLGFKKILDVIAANIPERKIHFNSTVSKIEYSNGQSVELTTSTGPKDCSSVIVTCSLGYLKKHAITLFTPALPEKKTKAIEAIAFGNMQKIYLVYSETWLDKVAYRTMGPSSSPIFGRGLAFDVTPWAKEVISGLSDAELMDKITEHLKTTLRNTTVPAPLRVIRHTWSEDPLVLGAYSSHTPASTELDEANGLLAEPIMGEDGRPLVQFAGEATHSTAFATTIGAFISGQREAARLVKK